MLDLPTKGTFVELANEVAKFLSSMRSEGFLANTFAKFGFPYCINRSQNPLLILALVYKSLA